MSRHVLIKKALLIILILLNSFLYAQGKEHSEQKKHKSKKQNNTNIEANEFLTYRGQRKPVESDDFYILEFRTGGYAKDILTITLIFNQAVNPKSVTAQNIYVQSSRKYEVSGISFNKEGTRAQITVKDSMDFPISFQISEVQSYNGKPISLMILENILADETYIYDKENNQWKKF